MFYEIYNDKENVKSIEIFFEGEDNEYECGYSTSQQFINDSDELIPEEWEFLEKVRKPERDIYIKMNREAVCVK